MKVAVIHNSDRSGVINVFGPQNREKYNPKTVELAAKALEEGGHTVRVIDGNMRVIEQLQDFMPRVIAGDRPGMVFNMAYGIQGVSRYTHLPAMLEMLGVPYVGSNPLAHGLALDKVVAKIVFKNAGLPTPGFWNFASVDDSFDNLAFPVIVKPKMEAVSYGIRVVDNEADLREAVEEILREFKQHVLVEQFVAGREFAVGLLGNRDPEVLPIVEIDLEGDPNAIQSAGDKLIKPRGKICPAHLPEDRATELRALVKRAFSSLDLFDFARVDVRMDAAGNFYLLEINSMASLGRTGTYVHAAAAAGYSYEDLINRMLDVAAIRYFGQDYLRPSAEGGEREQPQKFSARVRTYLRSQAPTIEDTLRKMVEMHTPVTEVERVNALGEWLTAQLGHLGFGVRVFPQAEVGNILYFTNHDEEEDDVLLLGHLDTASSADGHVRFREDGNRLYGTGVAEGKGGIAVAIAAFRALRYARALRKVRCGLLLSTDDTLSGAHARRRVEEFSGRAGHVVGLKAGDLEGRVIVSRSGRATYRLEVTYRASKKVLTEAEVVDFLCNRTMDVQDLSEPENGVRVGITHIDFRGTVGRLPTRAEIGVTVRFNDPADASTIDDRIRQVAKKRSPPGVRLHVAGRVRRPPLPRNAATEALVASLTEIADRLSLKIAPAHRWHSSDICFVTAPVPVIDGLGPLGSEQRTAGEFILRNSLVDRAALLALLLRHCASVGRANTTG